MTDLGNTKIENLSLNGVFEGIRSLQKYCYDAARTRGFHDDADALNQALQEMDAATAESPGDDVLQQASVLLKNAFRDRVGNRLMLITGEVSEAHEELRKGRAPNERYYSAPASLISEVGSVEKALEILHKDGLAKPEGLPSELADALIRILDLSGELKIDLAEVIREKLVFNETRARMHGVKF